MISSLALLPVPEQAGPGELLRTTALFSPRKAWRFGDGVGVGGALSIQAAAQPPQHTSENKVPETERGHAARPDS